MKRFHALLTALVWVLCLPAFSQHFFKKDLRAMSDKLSGLQAEWVAIDPDTLLDVIVTGESEGQLKLYAVRNHGADSLGQAATQMTGFANGHFQLGDWNGDNRIDVLIAGTTLVGTPAIFVFQNNGDFTFTKVTTKLAEHAGNFRLADLDQDGRQDLVTYNTTYLRMHQNLSNRMEKVYDTAGVIRDVSLFDYNRDGRVDLAISGVNGNKKAVTMLLMNKGSFQFEVAVLLKGIDGRLSAHDQNKDGLFDLVAAGKDTTSMNFYHAWHNLTTGWTITSMEMAPDHANLFTGDLNSDGKSDVLIDGWLNSKRTNYLLDSGLHRIDLDTSHLVLQRPGDFDRDGDLDVLHLIDSANITWLKVLENRTKQTNLRPSVPQNAFAISAFDRTFLFWQAPEDDHTASSSLTYDVWLGNGTSTLITPTFSLANGRRSVVQHGNAGTNNSVAVRGLTDDRYYYFVQSIDNAYNGSYSLCTGGVVPCFDLAHETLQTCRNDVVQLKAEGLAWWYSTSTGFLHMGAEYSFAATKSDTLFSFVPQGTDCSKNRVWVIHVNEASQSVQETIHACEGKDIRLGISPGWEDISWNTVPPTANVDSITWRVQRQEVISVTANSAGGCTYQKEFTIKLSKPTLQLNGETFQILKGNQVQLSATGTGVQYKWTPSEGLNNDAISDPVATPSVTTTFQVTATDTVGCQASAQVLIQVEETAFVPNLFTPNGDGKNDALLVYGLTQASDFSFRIFNREGNVVYETSTIAEAAGTGWNGTSAGTQQPSGVYYWKVEGKTITGERLLLNGKRTGSILLVH
jgi:gliding motility-associated-like protein